MNTKRCWMGYLEAGSKSSAVLHDPTLDTGNDSTMYLFNLERGVIAEYHRATVEPKLRPLRDDESEQMRALRDGYQRVRKDFEPRGAKTVARTPRAAPEVRSARASEDDDDAEFELDTDLALAVEDE